MSYIRIHKNLQNKEKYADQFLRLMYARRKQSEPYLQIVTLVQYKRYIELHKSTRSGAKRGERRNALGITMWEPLGKRQFARSRR
jgi:hypothetical protein